jgi:hypothetical protein
VTPIGRLLSLVAGIALFIGAFLPWSGVVGQTRLVPVDIRSQWAFGLGGASTTDLWPESLLFVLIVAAVLVLVGAITGYGAVALVGAIVSGVTTVAWILQVADSGTGVDANLLDRLGPGVAVTALGVALALIAALFMRQPKQDAVIIGG